MFVTSGTKRSLPKLTATAIQIQSEISKENISLCIWIAVAVSFYTKKKHDIDENFVSSTSKDFDKSYYLALIDPAFDAL